MVEVCELERECALCISLYLKDMYVCTMHAYNDVEYACGGNVRLQKYVRGKGCVKEDFVSD